MPTTTTTTSAVSSATADPFTSAATSSTSALGKDAFLKLLTAQLSNQDPLQPVDNQAFVAQLAQFSSLEQLQGVATRLDSLLAATSAASQLDSASLIGKDVTFKTTAVDLVEGQPPPALQASLAARASLTVLIQDPSGRTVRTLALGAQGPGFASVPWDGLDDGGNALPPGHYGVRVGARAADGSTVTADVRATGRVQGIDFSPSGAQVVIGATRIPISDVQGITSPRTSP